MDSDNVLLEKKRNRIEHVEKMFMEYWNDLDDFEKFICSEELMRKSFFVGYGVAEKEFKSKMEI